MIPSIFTDRAGAGTFVGTPCVIRDERKDILSDMYPGLIPCFMFNWIVGDV